MTEKAPSRYACLACGWKFDPARGDEKAGLPAGTDLAEVPADWKCPRCGSGSNNFARLDD